MDAVSERRIAGAGTPAARWRAQLDATPPAPLVLPPRARLVVLAPHPDDEVLACGALLAQHLAERQPARVIAATDGEASHGTLADDARTGLAACRRAEQVASVAALGLPAAALQRWGLPDGLLRSRGDELEQRLTSLLQPGDCLVTTWSHDGHPDHEACGTAALRVAARLGIVLLQAPVWAWHWCVPGDPRLPWSRLRAWHPDGDARAAKARALQCHRSQLSPRSGCDGAVLGASILERAAWPLECYIV